MRQRQSAEKRLKKRKREQEESEVYTTHSKRKGTASNRRERGVARERMPHVMFREKIEAIRAEIEMRPTSGVFHRPVSRKAIPRYYEVISEPIDLQTIRDKNQKYEYRTAEAFLKDLDLMRRNCIKFNGKESPFSKEAEAICEYARKRIDEQRAELTALEEMVEDFMTSGKKKKSRVGGGGRVTALSSATAMASGNNVVVDGVAVNLGDLDKEFEEIEGSDSDDSFSGLLGK
jgi:hypothetical protein